jgi:molecular chaperone GrpE (heat shock protein)
VPTAGTGSTGGDALSTSSAALATSEATLAKRRAAAAAQKEAIRSLAQSLLSVSSALEGELKDKDDQDDKRKALHSNIDSSMSALRSLLAMDSLQ